MVNPLKKGDVLRLAQIVREETGNEVQEKNYTMIEARMRSRLNELGMDSMEDYWNHFDEHEVAEREALLSLMTTHYTFFFREYAHFEVLGRWIELNALRLKERFQKANGAVKVWSAACSRGQEVYSLAMFLEVELFKKHGVPYEVLGTDIDAESVAKATNGVYPLEEVNTIPRMYLSGYWRRGTGPNEGFAGVQEKLKERTRFDVINLLNLSDVRPNDRADQFDIIFCRNVFIYFSQRNVQKIAQGLAARIDDQGLIVSGVSEPLRFEGWTFNSVGPSCYQKSVTPVDAKPMLPNAYPLSTSATVGGRKTSFPLDTIDSNVAPAASINSSSSLSLQPTENRYRVLCVDDSSTIQTLMKKIFSQDSACIGVDIAGNGREARERLNRQRYDLVTLDIHMPEVNGIEFLERLYDRKKDPPVIMISSVNRADLDLVTKSLVLGAFDYVEKPAMNGLEKSTGEILTKAKMALRAQRVADSRPAAGFDNAIAKKVVVPDASQCLRIILASSRNIDKLEAVVRGQKDEGRSPASLILWNDEGAEATPIAKILEWTDRQVMHLRDCRQVLKPDHFYVALPQLHRELVSQLKVKSVSLQILDGNVLDMGSLREVPSLQVLLDESLTAEMQELERKSGCKVSDTTPATSFSSLSLEFFANLRKAVA